MSERINVDQAFDPEARKAQAELDAYMDSRPYQDEKGNVHAAQGGKFLNYDKHHDALRDSHYDESLEQGDYSGESLEELARRVAAARAEGDKTRATDAEEVFFNKFAEYSEKYGWDEPNVSEDASMERQSDVLEASLGRDTIDVRLERYSKIMYGEDAEPNVDSAKSSAESENESVQNNEVQKEAVVAETPAAESDDEPYVPKRRGEYKDETDTSIYDELMAKHRAEAAAETPAEPEEDKPAGMDVDAEVEAAKAKLAEEAARKEAEAVAEINGTGQAKTDRELLEGATKESASSKLKVLDEEPVVKKASELKVLDEGGDDAEEVEDSKNTKEGIISKITAPAATKFSVWTATHERGGRRNRLIAVLGGGALAAGLGWFMMHGHDVTAAKDAVTPDVAPTPDITSPDLSDIPLPSGNGNGHGHHLVETVRVRPGDGEIKVTQSLLESNGVHVNTTEAQQIGEHANVHDILKGDASYAHSGSSMDRIGRTGEFETRKGVVSKLLKAARQLGYK